MVDQNLLISLKVNGAYLFTHHKSKHYTTSLKMNIMTRTEESYASHFPPFSKYKIAPVPKSEHRTLSIDQVQQIIDLPYKQNARNGGQPVFNLAKDLFILSFAMMGMNSADFYNAPTAENEIITYQRTKTRTRREDKAEMKVRIEPEIKSLFEKYSDPSGEKVFIFHKWYRSSENFNKSINKRIR